MNQHGSLETLGVPDMRDDSCHSPALFQGLPHKDEVGQGPGMVSLRGKGPAILRSKTWSRWWRGGSPSAPSIQAEVHHCWESRARQNCLHLGELSCLHLGEVSCLHLGDFQSTFSWLLGAEEVQERWERPAYVAQVPQVSPDLRLHLKKHACLHQQPSTR